MAYIGRGIELGQHIKQTLETTAGLTPGATVPNGVITVFPMDLNASQNSLLVVYGNVIQEPGVGYTVSGTTITFTSAPAASTSLYIIYLGQELTSVANPTTAEVDTQIDTKIAASGHTTATAASSEAAALAIALGG